MKKNIINTLLSSIAILAVSTTVLGAEPTKDVQNPIKDSMPSYVFLNTAIDSDVEPIELTDERDADKLISHSLSTDEVLTFNLTIEQGILLMESSADVDFEEKQKELKEDLKDLKASEYLVYRAIDSNYVPEAMWGSNPNSKTLVDISPYVDYHSGVLGLEYAIEALENSEKLSKDSYELTLETLAMNDNTLKYNIELAKKAFEQEKINFERNELKHELGMISDSDLDDSKKALNSKELELENLSKTYDNLKINIASALGLKDTDLVTLQYTPKLEPVTKTADEYVEMHIKYAPNYKSAKANKERAKEVYELEEIYYFEPNEDSYEEAKTTSANIAQNIQKATYQSYNTLETNLNNLEIAVSNLESAKKEYEEAKLMYDLGYISKSVMEQLELAYISSEIALENAKYAYDAEKLRLDTIYLSS